MTKYWKFCKVQTSFQGHFTAFYFAYWEYGHENMALSSGTTTTAQKLGPNIASAGANTCNRGLGAKSRARGSRGQAFTWNITNSKFSMHVTDYVNFNKSCCYDNRYSYLQLPVIINSCDHLYWHYLLVSLAPSLLRSGGSIDLMIQTGKEHIPYKSQGSATYVVTILDDVHIWM